MKLTRYRYLGPVLVICSLYIPTASTQSVDRKAYVFHGTVEEVNLTAGTLTVNGENLEGWMAAMSMSYRVDKVDVLKEIKVGDRIAAKVYSGDLTLYDVRRDSSTNARPTSQTLAAANAKPEVGEADDDEEVAYVCPMHSDQTSDVPGKCPRCGMTYVRTHPFDMRDYRLDFRTVPSIPQAGEELTLYFNISTPETGGRVTQFEVVHDKQYHLFVISQDMNYFQHIHPVESEDGTWAVKVKLPTPGYYEVLSDFLPSGGTSQFLARPLITAGFKGDLISQSAHLVPDTVASQTDGDLTATVEYDPNPITAGSYGHLSFHFTKGGTEEPVTDLQTYLGAFGHMLIMSEDMVNYVHSHPVDQLPPDANLETIRGGPDVMFEGLMPKPGRYRAWTQVRYHDKVHTFVNTFEVLDVANAAPR
ncbi:MAG: heavy metal-binding domain-containing protein [Bryobacteraceae bacterium]